MKETDKNQDLTRRDFLVKSGQVSAAVAISGSALMCSSEAWALEVKHIKPETMQTIIQVARDIYPHDRIANKYYAIACKAFDNADLKDKIEEGVGFLNQLAQAKFGNSYSDVGWEADRTSLLKQIENTPMFQAMRGSLVTGLYNQKEIWPLFGYEGASFQEGGYLNRGFNDIDWL